MLEVNVVGLKSEINTLNSLINEYEEILLNLFNQLKESCINWQDGYSLQFEDKIAQEKQEANLILQNLKTKKNVYNYIYDKYQELGNNIKCNLNNKNKVLNSIENNINQVEEIIRQFNSIDNSFYYYEYQYIQDNKQKMISIKNKLNNAKSTVSKYFQKIENYERDVANKIKELEEIKVRNFEFSFN